MEPDDNSKQMHCSMKFNVKNKANFDREYGDFDP